MQAVLTANVERAAYKRLMPDMDAVKIADGDADAGKGGQSFQRGCNQHGQARTVILYNTYIHPDEEINAGL
jgi:hypothetical protein